LRNGRRELLWQVGLLRTRGVQRGSAPLAGGVGGVPPASSYLPLPSQGRGPGGGVYQKALLLPIDQDLVALPPQSGWEKLVAAYEILGLSPQQHAMALLRGSLDPDIVTSAQAVHLPHDAEVRVAGLVTCRQRPSTAKGVVFVSLEDEYGLANVVVYPQLFDRERTLLITAPMLIVHGRVQRQNDVVHIVARAFERLEIPGERLARVSHDFR